MRATLVHRGPDEGSTDAFGKCLLGHQRLRVLDLRTGGQPVTSESGDVVAVFNGELYDFPELREDLSARGHAIPGTGDTPVIPHLYEDLGTAFVERLEGMFAIALWDRRRERLVLARDRLGKKPLLWTRLPDGTFAFASELKALLTLRELRRELDPAAIDAYLALQYVPGEQTALRGVRRLPPGHVLVVEGGRQQLVRYWQPEAAEASGSRPELLERVRDTVGAAVRRRLAADVPLGALLSGGIDSSVVVALMAEAASGPVRTFSVGFSDPRYDEREHARAVAERYATEHTEIEVEPDDALALLPELSQAFDEPFGDSAALPLLLVCRQARKHVTVALTGDGGDETFAGYERYAAHEAARLVPGPPARLAARALRSARAGREEARSPLFRAARFFEVAGEPAATRYGRVMEVFPPELRARLWNQEAKPTAELLGPPPRGLRELQLLDLTTYLPDDLLFKTDIASMASSLEIRSPLLDPEVVALGLALPESLKVRRGTGKLALRQAFAAELPERTAARPKRGFGVPIARWFRAELRPLAQDALLDGRSRDRGLFRPEAVRRLFDEHLEGRADHGHRLWTLLMLELWLRDHVEAPAESPSTLARS